MTATAEELAGHFQCSQPPRVAARYNIAPGGDILAVVAEPDLRLKFVHLHWGLIPAWAKDSKISPPLINARAETVQQKPSFRAAFKQRRCLIPATGYYEWQALPERKQAYLIQRLDKQLFAFAGLWELWQQGNTAIYSCTLITTSAGPVVRDIHERMPVIIARADYRLWLNQNTPPEQLAALLGHFDDQTLAATAISPWVNNPRHDDPKCLQ